MTNYKGIRNRPSILKETPYTLGHRLWSLLPLWKFWAAQNIASGEKGSIFRSGKVHRRYNNAKSKCGTARLTFVDAWSARPTQKSWTLDHRCMLCPDYMLHKLWWDGCKRFTSGHGIAGTVSDVRQRSTAVINFSLALVWRCLCGSNARFRSFRSLPLR